MHNVHFEVLLHFNIENYFRKELHASWILFSFASEFNWNKNGKCDVRGYHITDARQMWRRGIRNTQMALGILTSFYVHVLLVDTIKVNICVSSVEIQTRKVLNIDQILHQKY